MKTNIIYNYSCSKVMKSMPDDSVDLILTDPPYNLGLANKKMFQKEFLRICKGAIVVFAPADPGPLAPALVVTPVV